MTQPLAIAEIDRVFRDVYGRAVSVLVGAFGDIDIAEDAVQDAFSIALARWTASGLPPNPAGWIITTARNRAIDWLRRESTRSTRHEDATVLHTNDAPVEEGVVPDQRLRLIFTCCHPSLAIDAQVALTLRLLGGLTTPEVARAFLVSEPTMAQRLVRAKRRIREAGLAYRIPEEADLPERLRSVLAVIYLIFNEGYFASSADVVVREELCAEAIRLGRLLQALVPREPEVTGLLALMLLAESRRGARVAQCGEIVRLPDQNRGLWDWEQIAEGLSLVRECIRDDRPGPYQLQAAIQAVHCSAPSAEATDWIRILALYDRLASFTSSPIAGLNRAVAVAEVHGPAVALGVVDDLKLGTFHRFHAVRADLLRRLGRCDEASSAYEAAIARCGNAAERSFLRQRREELSGS